METNQTKILYSGPQKNEKHIAEEAEFGLFPSIIIEDTETSAHHRFQTDHQLGERLGYS